MRGMDESVEHVTSRLHRIDAPNVQSLCWRDDALVDWAGGGRIFHLDGTIEECRVRWGSRFDGAVASPCGELSIIYEKLGTKGLVLRHGKLVREINRSYYHSDVY